MHWRHVQSQRSALLPQLRCEGLEFIIDGVERPIQRPKNPSGKGNSTAARRSTTASRTTSSSTGAPGRSRGSAPTCEGKKLADEQALRFPKGSKLWKDTGFQGYEPEEVTTLQAKKKPKGGKLSPAEKEANRRVSKLRVRVEHSSAGVKVLRNIRYYKAISVLHFKINQCTV